MVKPAWHTSEVEIRQQDDPNFPLRVDCEIPWKKIGVRKRIACAWQALFGEKLAIEFHVHHTDLEQVVSICSGADDDNQSD